MTTVLVVDDCLTDRRRAGGLLARGGHEIAYAEHGRDALERISDCRPDAVVTDLQMPVGSIGPTRARCLDKLRRALTQGGDR